MDKLISVIVPVYNAEKTLPKCVDSIRKQTYDKLEIILINDGSNDSSLEICKLLAEKDNRIKVIDKKNTGVSDTRNVGLDIATGDFVTFVDSDDFIQADMYDKMINSAIDNASQVVACKFKLIHEASQDDYKEPYIKQAFAGELKYFIIDKNSVHGSACRLLIERASMGDLRFVKNIKIKEDLLFTVELLKSVAKTSIVDESLYNYVITSNDLNYQKYFNEKYIKDYYYFAVAMSNLLNGSGCDQEIRIMLFKQYFEICKCKIYAKGIGNLRRYFTADELKLMNNKQTYKSYVTQNIALKSKVFAILAHRKMFIILKFMQKIVNLKK